MRIKTAIRCALLAATVAGGAGVTTWSIGSLAAGARAAGEAATRPCQNFQVTVRPGQSNGATGHIAIMYRIHNILPGACTLFGYPGAELLDRNFSSLPTHVHRGLGFLAGKHAPSTVTLQGNQDGFFILEWVHFPSPGQSCPPASYLLITPPNDRLPVVTYAARGGGTIVACGGNLTVSPVSQHPQFE
jgi:hypothetical protein